MEYLSYGMCGVADANAREVLGTANKINDAHT
jgi:hypothetical protein